MAQAIREKLKGIDGLEEVVSRLKAHDKWQHVQAWRNFGHHLELSAGYFRFLSALSQGGLMQDIARRARVDLPVALTWPKGVRPRIVRKAIESSRTNDSRIEVSGSSARGMANSKETNRRGWQVSMKRPEVRGVAIESPRHLQQIINRDFSGIKEYRLYPKWLHEACIEIRAYNLLKNRAYLNYGEGPRLAKRFDIKP